MAQAPRANVALWMQDGTARRRAQWWQSAAGAQHLQGSAELRHWHAQGMAPYPTTQAGAGACAGVQDCAPPAASRPGSAHGRGGAAEPAGKPGAGDLRGPRFRCSRCARDLSAAGFAQRVLHVKKCAAAGARPGLQAYPNPTAALRRRQPCAPKLPGLSSIPLVTGCVGRAPSVPRGPRRICPAGAASCGAATSSSAAAGAPHMASLTLRPKPFTHRGRAGARGRSGCGPGGERGAPALGVSAVRGAGAGRVRGRAARAAAGAATGQRARVAGRPAAGAPCGRVRGGARAGPPA